MNNKILLIALVIMLSIVAILGWKIMSASPSNSDKTTIYLSTNPSPLRLGQAIFAIEVKDKNGKPIDNATVSFDLNMTTMNMGAQRGNATSQGDGKYSTSGTMSMKGPWRVRTTVKMPDGSIENKDFTVNVQ